MNEGMNDLSGMALASLSDEPTLTPGGREHSQNPEPGRFRCGIGSEPLGSDHLARKMPRTCPSPLRPTLGEGWLPLGLSPLLEAWVAAGRTGWEQPLPLGAEVSTWRAPRVADANTAAHTWSPSRLLPARPPLPTLARLPWTGPPSPSPRPCGAPTRTTCRKSGEAPSWARAARPPGAGGLREEPGPSAEPGPGLLQPQARLAGLARPARGAGPSWKGVGCLGVPVPLGASVSLSVEGADTPAVSPSQGRVRAGSSEATSRSANARG